MDTHHYLLGKAGKGGATLLTRRVREGTHFDDLARGLDTGAISRGKAMKLGGAALVASALGLFTSQGADAQEVSIEAERQRCRRKGGDFCRDSGCRICCGEGRRRRTACCGPEGCNCCRRNERCANDGRCRPEA
jgi:hypothetical protein